VFKPKSTPFYIFISHNIPYMNQIKINVSRDVNLDHILKLVTQYLKHKKPISSDLKTKKALFFDGYSVEFRLLGEEGYSKITIRNENVISKKIVISTDIDGLLDDLSLKEIGQYTLNKIEEIIKKY